MSIICFLIGLPGKEMVHVACCNLVVIVLVGCRVSCWWVVCAVVLLGCRPVGCDEQHCSQLHCWEQCPGSSGLGLVVFLTHTSHSSKLCSGASPGAFAHRHFHPCFFHANLRLSVTKLYIFSLHWLPLSFHEQNLQVTVLGRVFWNINFK